MESGEGINSNYLSVSASKQDWAHRMVRWLLSTHMGVSQSQHRIPSVCTLRSKLRVVGVGLCKVDIDENRRLLKNTLDNHRRNPQKSNKTGMRASLMTAILPSSISSKASEWIP